VAVPTPFGFDASGGAPPTALSSTSIGEEASDAVAEDDMVGEAAASKAAGAGTAVNGTGGADAAGEGTAKGTTA